MKTRTFRVVENRGREQSFTVWGSDGMVYFFAPTLLDAQLWIHNWQVRQR